MPSPSNGFSLFGFAIASLRLRSPTSAITLFSPSAFGGVINFRLFFEWFRGRQEYENSIRVETPNAEDPQLHAVKKAILIQGILVN